MACLGACRLVTMVTVNDQIHSKMSPELAMRFDVRRVRFGDSPEAFTLDDSSLAVVRAPSKCILCDETIGMGIIDLARRGYNMRVSLAFGRNLSETRCISCG